MHVAQQLRSEQFECRMGGETVGREAILGEWHPLDRFGLVVDEPLGGLGASLLLQLAITQFFDCRPDRRGAGAAYPEFALFHLGGPHGDFSHFDFWPPRKEVLLPANDPLALLEAVNAAGISMLALPEGEHGDLSALESGPSSWAEQGSALDRLRTTFLYSPSGRVDRPDFELLSAAPQARENIDGTLDIMSSVRAIRERVAASGRATTGVMGDADDLRWAEIVETRLDEVRPEAFELAAARVRACVDPGTGALVQSHAILSPDAALARIAGTTGVAAAGGSSR